MHCDNQTLEHIQKIKSNLVKGYKSPLSIEFQDWKIVLTTYHETNVLFISYIDKHVPSLRIADPLPQTIHSIFNLLDTYDPDIRKQATAFHPHFENCLNENGIIFKREEGSKHKKNKVDYYYTIGETIINLYGTRPGFMCVIINDENKIVYSTKFHPQKLMQIVTKTVIEDFYGK